MSFKIYVSIKTIVLNIKIYFLTKKSIIYFAKPLLQNCVKNPKFLEMKKEPLTTVTFEHNWFNLIVEIYQ